MDFDFTSDQLLLSDSLSRLLADRYSFEQRRRFEASEQGWSREMWAQYAEFGLLGLPFSEENGGFGGGSTGTLIAMEAFGRALALEPFLSTVVIGGGLIELAGSAAQREEHLPRIIEGALLVSLAHAEQQARDDLFDVETTARADADGFLIDGTKELVLHGDSAELLIVSARTSGDGRDEHGITLFLVPADAPGVTRTPGRTQDRHRVARVSLAGVRVTADQILGQQEQGFTPLSEIMDKAVAAICAEAYGAMESAQNLTIDYLKTRQQFGQPIGKFQALQHRAANMLVVLELARSMSYYATVMAEEPNPAERARAVSAAKVQICRSAQQIGQEGIQLHGGIGITEEYALGHYARRLLMIEQQFGDVHHHLGRVAQAGGMLSKISNAELPAEL